MTTSVTCAGLKNRAAAVGVLLLLSLTWPSAPSAQDSALWRRSTLDDPVPGHLQPRRADLVLIPAGIVTIGDPAGLPDEQPSFCYTSSAFLMDQTPVTVAQLRPSWPSQFCRTYGARLPTEFEWERAARLGQTRDGHVFKIGDPFELSGHYLINAWEGIFPLFVLPT